MEMKDYLEQSARTVSDKFYPELINELAFEALVSNLISYGNQIDVVKKALFYGKQPFGKIAVQQGNITFKPSLFEGMNLSPTEIDLLHGILGKITESVELLEAFVNAGKDTNAFRLHIGNALEEVGDGLWYDALILRSLGATFEEVAKTNIDKLKLRFPEKFTERNAVERNLTAEHALLDNAPEALRASVERTACKNANCKGACANKLK